MAPGSSRPHMIAARFLALLAASLLLGGCLGGDAEPTVEAQAASSAEPDAPANATAAPMAMAPVALGASQEIVLYLTPDGGLAKEPGAAGSVLAPGSYATCLTGAECPHGVFRSEALPASLQLDPGVATVTLWVEATAPVAPGIFDFVAWIGTTEAMMLTAEHKHGVPILPGAPIEIEIPIDFSALRAIPLPKGESIQIYLISGMMHEGTGILKIHTGGDKASFVRMEARSVELPPAGPLLEDSFAGEVAQPGMVFAPVTGGHTAAHAIKIEPSAKHLWIHLKLTGSAYGRDLDLDLLDGSSVIAGSHTPRGEETIHLAGEGLTGLEGRELQVRVSNFFAAGGTYEIHVTQA